jgi:hypothetical protein
VRRAAVLIALATACAVLPGCGGDEPNARKLFAEALDKTWRAGSARMSERVRSDPHDLEFEVRGRTRFDFDDALLNVTYRQHPSLDPGVGFHVRIANLPYVRRIAGGWYVPPHHTGEFELGFANFLHLLSRAYGRVRMEGERTFLVTMSRSRLMRLRMSREGSIGPLGTLFDLIGPMRVDVDGAGRIERIRYEVSGRYYFALTPMHRVRVTFAFSDYERDFDVEPPPEDEITSGPLQPPQDGARAEMSRL